MHMTENVTNIFAALVKFQSLVKNPPKTKTAQVGKFSYKYADLSVIMDAIRQPLKDAGLAIIQNTVSENGEIRGVQTILIHESGEALWFDPVYIKPPADPTPQQIGSSLTYARRYSLCMALGIAADEDDDAQAAETPQEPQQVQKPKRQVDPERQRLLQSMAQSFEDWQNGITPDMKKRLEEEKELEERKKKGRRMIAIACKEKGLSDEERRLIIQDLTGKSSSKELTLEELKEVYALVSEHSAEKLQEIVKAIKYKKMDEVFGQETA